MTLLLASQRQVAITGERRQLQLVRGNRGMVPAAMRKVMKLMEGTCVIALLRASRTYIAFGRGMLGFMIQLMHLAEHRNRRLQQYAEHERHQRKSAQAVGERMTEATGHGRAG